jgi:hypothetical protein
VLRDTLFYLSSSLLLLSVSAGFLRWPRLDGASRIFTVVLAVTSIVEGIAYVFAIIYRNNIVVYRLFAPVELVGYCLYFNCLVPQLHKWAAGWLLGIGSVAVAVLFEHYYPEDVFGNRFAMIQSVTMICLCLYAFFTMLLRDDIAMPTRNAHFWLVASLTFFWCFSFLSFALYDVHALQTVRINWLLDYLIHIGNIGMLLGVAGTFIFLPRLQSSSSSWKATI